MIKNLNATTLLCFCCIFLLSCSLTDLNSELQGTWHIAQASRNGRNTSTFENGYFKFWNNDSLETNITGEIIKTNYNLQKKIVLSDGILPDFDVISNELDTMTFQFVINETHFHLVLSKTDHENK